MSASQPQPAAPALGLLGLGLLPAPGGPTVLWPEERGPGGVPRVCFGESGGHQGADFFSAHHTQDVSRAVHVEYDHGQIIVLAQAHCSAVHYL